MARSDDQGKCLQCLDRRTAVYHPGSSDLGCGEDRGRDSGTAATEPELSEPFQPLDEDRVLCSRVVLCEACDLQRARYRGPESRGRILPHRPLPRHLECLRIPERCLLLSPPDPKDRRNKTPDAGEVALSVQPSA